MEYYDEPNLHHNMQPDNLEDVNLEHEEDGVQCATQ